jgi:ribosomal protein RSM22 (predicted rRNA methylase)
MRPEWQEMVEGEIEKIPPAELARAAQQISDAYRSTRAGQGPLIRTAAHRAAYLAVRMPATYAAMVSAVGRLHDGAPMLSPTSVLDLGAGPGTAALAALKAFPSISTVTLLERDAELAALSGRLVPEAKTLVADLSSATFPEADLVLCAYALNELSPTACERVLRDAMKAARQGVIFVEPGSREGFAHVLAAREVLIANSAFEIAAPCPGHMPCPLAEIGEWCHFSARVQRSSLHRRLKDAVLSYEDEKFSYVAAVRSGAESAQARIVTRPEKLTGHVKLSLCTCGGLRLATVTKKHGADYKVARKAEWGDAFRII